MRPTRSNALRCLAAAARVLTVSAVIVAGFVLAVRVLVHFPFYDETMHAHYLWLLSDGQAPGADFFCYYPVLGYLLVLPVFKLFPESAFVLLALRYLTLGLTVAMGIVLHRHARRVGGGWAVGVLPLVLLAVSRNIGPFWSEFSLDHMAALPAVAAMALYLRKPGRVEVGAASALSLLSVLIMPKYAFPLLLGLFGFLIAAWRAAERPARVILSVCIGGGATLLLAAATFRYHSVPFFESLRTTLILQSVHQLTAQRSELARYVAMNLVFKPVFGAVLVLGVVGWARRSWGRAGAGALGGAGILAGVLLTCAIWGNPLEQYQAPVYVSLAVFSPFALSVVPGLLTSRLLATGFAAAGCAIAVAAVPPLARELTDTSLLRHSGYAFRVPPAFVALANMDELLRIVPRDERVVALWGHHPMFRRDLTPMAGDAQPSFSTGLPAGSPLARMFDPETFRTALRERPPALVALAKLEDNYPPGWAAVAREFMSANADRYQALASKILPTETLYLRKDLLK